MWLWRYLGPVVSAGTDLACQPPGEHVMSNSNLTLVVAVMAHRLSRHEPAPALAPVLAPVGMALLVLAVLGAIVLLVGGLRTTRLPRVAAVRR